VASLRKQYQEFMDSPAGARSRVGFGDAPVRGEMRGPVHPRLQAMTDGLRSHIEDSGPMGKGFAADMIGGGSVRYLNKLARGEQMDAMDYFIPGLELPGGALTAAAKKGGEKVAGAIGELGTQYRRGPVRGEQVDTGRREAISKLGKGAAGATALAGAGMIGKEAVERLGRKGAQELGEKSVREVIEDIPAPKFEMSLPEFKGASPGRVKEAYTINRLHAKKVSERIDKEVNRRVQSGDVNRTKAIQELRTDPRYNDMFTEKFGVDSKANVIAKDWNASRRPFIYTQRSGMDAFDDLVEGTRPLSEISASPNDPAYDFLVDMSADPRRDGTKLQKEADELYFGGMKNHPGTDLEGLDWETAEKVKELIRRHPEEFQKWADMNFEKSLKQIKKDYPVEKVEDMNLLSRDGNEATWYSGLGLDSETEAMIDGLSKTRHALVKALKSGDPADIVKFVDENQVGLHYTSPHGDLGIDLGPDPSGQDLEYYISDDFMDALVQARTLADRYKMARKTKKKTVKLAQESPNGLAIASGALGAAATLGYLGTQMGKSMSRREALKTGGKALGGGALTGLGAKEILERLGK